MEIIHPIAAMEGTKLGDYVLQVITLQQMKMSGWRFFAIGLSTLPQTHKPHGLASKSPIVEGIYSRGGKGVAPWMEILSYQSRVELADRSGVRLTVDLAAIGLDKSLFELLGGLIPPGGHIMVWYESKQDEETYLALNRGVPSVITELGSLLFWAGCLAVRDFSMPEGGLEGCRKLWGEKPMNEHHEQVLKKRTAELLRNFLAGECRLGRPQLEMDMRARAREILSALEA